MFGIVFVCCVELFGIEKIGGVVLWFVSIIVGVFVYVNLDGLEF